MLKAGRTQTLTVNRISDYGLYLIDDEQNEVLLPNRYVSLATRSAIRSKYSSITIRKTDWSPRPKRRSCAKEKRDSCA